MDTLTVTVVVTLAGFVLCLTESGNSITVETTVGKIVGFQREVNVFGEFSKVSRFLGIPYAEPPVGELRFQKPVPKTAFTSPFIAKQHGHICFQQHFLPTAKEIRDSEDCLFLNIYSPTGSVKSGLPVMIWIHGGGFVAGSADMYVSDTLAAFGKVIVVTFNYRLSIWGFFTSGTETGPTNYGLWDQHLAIKWVHDNIGAFGGDNNRVTIFGESAGSASVVYQCLFEGNRGLFQRAIGQSGSVTAAWASTSKFKADSEKLGKLVGCGNNDPTVLHECIKNTPAKLLNSILNNVTSGFQTLENSQNQVSFLPVVDGEFIQEQRQDIFRTNCESIKHKFFCSLDLMLGMTSAEGAGSIEYYSKREPGEFYPNRTFFEDTLVPESLRSNYGSNVPEVITLATIAEYTDWNDPANPEKIRDNLFQLWADLKMTASILETVNFHADHCGPGARTYLYQFDVKASHHLIPTPSWLKKANHADELIYLFGFGEDGMLAYLSNNKVVLDHWEVRLAQDIMRMWTNFAKTGDPNQPIGLKEEWPQYDLASQFYFDITRDTSLSQVKQFLFARNVNFWNKLIPSIIKAAGKPRDVHGSSSFGHGRDDTCGKHGNTSP